MEKRRENDEDDKKGEGSPPDLLNTTPMMSQGESDWAKLTLRQEQVAEAFLWKTEAWPWRAPKEKFQNVGGQIRGADHPRRTNLDSQTMGPDQLEARGAHWGCISFEQIAASREARKWPIFCRYSGLSPATARQRERFVSYEQGAGQILQYYLRIKWELYTQGWPDPLGRSIAFGIEETISGLYHPTIKQAMYLSSPPTMATLEQTAVQRVNTEQLALIHCTATHRVWEGLELENSPWKPYPQNRFQKLQIKQSICRQHRRKGGILPPP